MAYRVSYSAASTWRECPKRYEYSYIRKVRSKVEAPPLALGSLLHSYLEMFYNDIKDGATPQMAHGKASAALDAWDDKAKGLAGAAQLAGEEDTAKELMEIGPKARRITERYYVARGKFDADELEILHVELRIQHELTRAAGSNDAIIVPGVVDLVVRRRDTGIIQLIDHKSTKNIPRGGRRIRDLQLVLYAAMLEDRVGVKVQELVWNYLKTEEPTIPKKLKTGGLSRSRTADTTASAYRQAIAEHGYDEDDYAEELEHFADRELERFFPREGVPLMHDERILFGDFIITANQVVSAHIEYSLTGAVACAVRNLANHCDWCPFAKLCEAEIVGGDPEDIMRQRFKVG